ncbi:MAG: phospholipase [Gammaproteobacteria bacterium]|nr:phospholipase [Gammaproteobacteria bacterium]
MPEFRCTSLILMLNVALLTAFASTTVESNLCEIPVSTGHPVPPLPCRLDGCSAVPDFRFTECCNVHDRVYWEGGTRAERKHADQELHQCITVKGNAFIGYLYYMGVRVGGVPWLPTSWRWGFGWPYEKGHRGYRRESNPTK